MKGQLYALHIGSKWKWYLTIHIHTDIHYWFERCAAGVGMVLLEPFISLGQAVQLIRKLSSEQFPASSSSMSSSALQWLPMIQQAAAQCGLTQEVLSTLQLKPIEYFHWKQGLYPTLCLNSVVYESIVHACVGRSLLVEELEQILEFQNLSAERDVWLPYLQLAYLNGDLEIGSGMELGERREWRRGLGRRTTYCCKRCGSGEMRLHWSHCLHCGQECPYCEECLTMGRTRYCSLLIRGSAEMRHSEQYAGSNGVIKKHSSPEQGIRSPQLESYIEPWGLSDAQRAASLEGLRFLTERTFWSNKESRNARPRQPNRFLIWAVTGAGKTEMIFPFIHRTVECGGRALIATPRKDVVLELQPRISKAFAEYSVVTLYGGSEQRWERGQITIATTHQLLRFHEAFDLVIIDEIDAFPYHNNPMLEYAATKVCKSGGSTILLSATPPGDVRKAAERGRLPHVRVPVRYHRHPLPVPQWLSVPPLQSYISRNDIPAKLISRLLASLERGAQLFVFAPAIKLVEPMVQALRRRLSGYAADSAVWVEGTSSKDPMRTEKVQRFRSREIRLLVTTTILERGVTVPKSDVFILDADSGLFDEAALIQMAGRAGRSQDDPAGRVYFASRDWTRSQKEAVRQIKQMNRIARKQGYLRGGGTG